jgi:hypothetical protein
LYYSKWSISGQPELGVVFLQQNCVFFIQKK